MVKIRENKTNCMPTTVKNCPGAEVATLTGTVAENNRTYTAPANTVLKPNTTYWVVVNDGVTDNRVGWYTTFGHLEKLPSPRMGKLAGLREIPLQLTFS